MGQPATVFLVMTMVTLERLHTFGEILSNEFCGVLERRIARVDTRVCQYCRCVVLWCMGQANRMKPGRLAHAHCGCGHLGSTQENLTHTTMPCRAQMYNEKLLSNPALFIDR